MISQEDLNDLVRKLNLTKSNSELLALRLQQWNLPAPDTKITFYSQRSQDLLSHFSTNGELYYSNDVFALFQSNGIKENIKAVLLPNGNSRVYIRASSIFSHPQRNALQLATYFE